MVVKLNKFLVLSDKVFAVVLSDERSITAEKFDRI
jgi:hypothetical protein